MPTRSMTSAATRSASRRLVPAAMAAIATFSSTLTEPNGRISWNVRAMPACDDPVRCAAR